MLLRRGSFRVMMHAPVRVITVEREYGSHGAEFAHDLAARLGWRLLDSELVAGAARIAGIDPKAAAKFDERLDPWYYRYGKMFWQDPVYAHATSGDEKIFDSERMLELIKTEILDAAKQGNCVLVGRGSACALAGRPGAFMFLCTPRPAPRKNGSRGPFLRVRSRRNSTWRHLTGGARRSSASSISRSGARAGFTTCC